MFSHMRPWYYLVFMLVILIITCITPAMGYSKGDVIPPKPEANISSALTLDQAIQEMNWDVQLYGKPRWLWSGEDWKEKADDLHHDSQHDSQEATYTNMIMLSSGMITQEKFTELQQERRREEQEDSAFVIRYLENAADAYQRDNSNGKNDRKISDLHMQIADEYYYNFGDEYRDYQLQALEAATDADIYNVNAWDDRIRLLESMGRNDEAQQVRNEMNQRVGGSALESLFGLPISPMTVVYAILISGTILLIRRKETV